ncbi:pyrimidine/purine nucleoside phosphorylase [Marinomonas algicola]|jgi:purine/pyrimidine-nucleoside phosphorylase|uniref:pyrimidine/purine nucleoside phosphorylase n=1 Tax=Marinomonas algicola TaxID=2773454 RepID=UPI00174BED58|nr:pyrimidine/purine nucleoside phosphorylase [Marinomonas algicola]
MSALAVNSYFDDRVKSIALENAEGSSTVGVMTVGEYAFGTVKREYMTVVSGALKVRLPNSSDWQIFEKGQTFIVEANQSFDVIVTETTAYLCRYE